MKLNYGGKRKRLKKDDEQKVKSLCKANTKKGGTCRNSAMNGCDYCYVHSLGRFKRIPLLKNMTVHLLSILSILLMILFFFLGPSRAVQKNILEKISHNEELLRDHVEYHREVELLKKYPGGYALFGLDPSRNYEVDFEKRSIPYSGYVLKEYELRWDRVKISELTERTVTVELPDIVYKPLNSQIPGCAMVIKRAPLGEAYRVPIRPDGIINRIFVELVEDNSSVLIFAIGFKKE